MKGRARALIWGFGEGGGGENNHLMFCATIISFKIGLISEEISSAEEQENMNIPYLTL